MCLYRPVSLATTDRAEGGTFSPAPWVLIARSQSKARFCETVQATLFPAQLRREGLRENRNGPWTSGRKPQFRGGEREARGLRTSTNPEKDVAEPGITKEPVGRAGAGPGLWL